MAGEGNGKVVEHRGANGHAVISRPRKVKPQKTFIGSLFSVVTRLLTWYSIITIIFRCPQSIDLLTESSPKICKPYFQTKAIVLPYIAPYYNTYAASYVDSAKPYYEVLDKNVVSPVTYYGKKYGSPRVARAQVLAEAQWEKLVQPQLTKVNHLAQEQYSKTLEPHIKTLVASVGPYYIIAKDSALHTYYTTILPTYAAVQPYGRKAYTLGSEFVINTGIPLANQAWTSTIDFLDRTVWPKVRVLYGENVEPQLVRIGERLGRYRDGKKLQGAVDDVGATLSAQSATSTYSSMSSSISAASATSTKISSSSITSVSSSVSSSASPVDTPLSEEEQRAKAQEVVAEDLKTWQEKFARAADQGSDELDDRITEITDRAIQNQSGVGEAHLIQLEETVNSELKNLKKRIISLVKDSETKEVTDEDIIAAVRKAGFAIKAKAQAVRTWRQTFDHETNDLVAKAADDTFQIIDHIRDLGLQEIGMRWAWTDGITHKDWAKYHAMKNKFEEWRQDVEEVATGHPGLENARVASEDIESRAMAVAADAAKELGRLKETGSWKLSVGDTSDDWSTKHVPAAAVVAAKKVAEEVGEAQDAIVSSSTQGTVESLTSIAGSSIVGNVKAYASSISDDASSVASLISSSIEGPSNSAESIASVVEDSAASITSTVESGISAAQSSSGTLADKASSSVIGTSQGSLKSVVSVASNSASSVATEAYSSVIAGPPSVVEYASTSVSSVASPASDVASSSSSSLSSAISKSASSASGLDSSATSVFSELSDTLSSTSSSTSSSISSASSSVAKVWGGAVAQHVEARKIVYEDIRDDPDASAYTDKIYSMASEAGDRWAEITDAVSEALLQPTSTRGSVESVTSLAADQYSLALNAASRALFGTSTRAGESLASAASSKYADAVSAASVAIYGTPTPVVSSIASRASVAYREALADAHERYLQALSILSDRISATPKPIREQMSSSIESAYSGAVVAASSRLDSALAAVSPTSPLTAAFASISAVAASRLSEGLSLASAQYSSAKIALRPTPTPASQKYLAQAQNQYYAAVGLAHDRYTEFIESASSAIMPAPIPTGSYESAIAAAKAHYEEVISAAQSGFREIYNGGDPSPIVYAPKSATASYQSVASAAKDALASATSEASVLFYGTEAGWSEAIASAASENWEALVTKASLQVYGKPTPWTESLYSQAGEYAAQATDDAASQYSAMQSLINELVSGKEPEFTESVYSRFSSAYYTGAVAAASSVSSVADEAYSAVTSIFTPPPALEAAIDSAQSRISEAVEAASIHIYGTQKGAYEQAASSAATAYSSASTAASIKIYGSSTGYVEAAQSSIAEVASSAHDAIITAIYGSSTPAYESATSAVADAYASASSVVAENISAATSVVGDAYSSAQAKASSLVYGPEQGAVESAQARLGATVESARSQLAAYASAAAEGAKETFEAASEAVDEFASSVSSAVESKVSGIKDEL